MMRTSGPSCARSSARAASGSASGSSGRPERLSIVTAGRSGAACDGGASNLDYSTIPEGGPELIINVPYTIEGKVAVRYVDDSGGCSSDDAL